MNLEDQYKGLEFWTEKGSSGQKYKRTVGVPLVWGGDGPITALTDRIQGTFLALSVCLS
jgi:hypothetical protein